MRPKRSTIIAAMACQAASSVTSSWWNNAVPPAAPISSATAAPSASTSATTTLAPSRANRRAMAAPMPLAAPVTMATLFSSLIVILPPAIPSASIHVALAGDGYSAAAIAGLRTAPSRRATRDLCSAQSAAGSRSPKRS